MFESIKSKKHLFCMFIPLLFCLVYLALCVLNLNGSIWFDEAYSAYLIRGNFADIWQLTAADVHPPFFYFCLKIWSLIFGNSAVALRFMSVFFGGVAIILAFHLVKRWFGVKVATIGTALLSLAPVFIRYGQEMRMYTLVFAIVLAATYVLELALENPKRRRYWIFYAILLALGMWTHYFTAAAWVAQLFYLIFVRKQNPLRKPLLLTYILAVALFAAWLPFLWQQIQNVQQGFWIPEISALTPIDYLTDTLLYLEGSKVTNWLALLFLSVVIFTTFITVKVAKKLKTTEKRNFYALLSLVLIPPLVLVILSLPPLTSVFINRYILYSASLIWLLIGVVIILYKAKKPLAEVLLAVLALTSATIGIFNVETRAPEEDIKDIVSLVDQLAADSEPILANNIWTYYGAIFYSTDTHPIYLPNDWADYYYGSEKPVETYRYHVIDDFKDFQDQHETFWYLTDAPGSDSVSATIAGQADTTKSPVDGYRIVSTVGSGSHIALELAKCADLCYNE